MIRPFLFAILLVASAVQAAASCSDNRVDIRGDWGLARFTVEVADEPAERSLGLMHRQTMSGGAGMLFVYDEPQRVAFWMRNTLIPLDIIFMDRTGTVTRIHENAIPLDETTIPGGDQVQFVLEINGGLTSKLGIDEGSVLRHPAIEPHAAWPCE